MRRRLHRLRSCLDDLPLTWAIALALLLGMTLPFTVSAWLQGEQYRQAKLRHLADDQGRILETLVIGMATPIWEIRPDTGRPLVEAVMRDERVTAVTVSAPLLPEFISAVRPERRLGRLFSGAQQVYYRGEPVGIVQVEMSAAPLDAELAHRRRQTLITGVGQLVLGLTLIFLILRHKVLQPVQQLVAQSRALAARQLDQSFHWVRADELGTLGRSFENTRRSLQQLFRDLETRNAALAQREAELARQTDILRVTLDNMSDGITLVDGDLRLQAWNDRFLTLLRLPPDIVRHGSKLTDFYDFEMTRDHVLDAPTLRERMLPTFEPGRQRTVLMETKDGQVISCRRQPLPGGGFVTTYSDITEPVRAKRRVDEALHLLEAVMNAVPAILHVKDRELRYRMVNRRFLETWQLTPDQVIGKRAEEVFSPECLAQVPHVDADVVATGTALPFTETVIAAADGRRRDGLMTKVPLTDADGQVSHIVTVTLDITERKEAERALRESEELYRLLVDLSPYGIMLHDLRGIVFLNTAGCRILGLARSEDARGRHYLDFVLPDERPAAQERIEHLFATSEPLSQAERRLSAADGRLVDVAVAAVMLQHGNERRALVMFRDITERKRVEQERQRWLQLFHDAIEAVPNGFAVFDANDRLLVCNSAFADHYDVRPETLVGITTAELKPKLVAGAETINGRPAADAAEELFGRLARRDLEALGPVLLKRKDGRTAQINYYPSAEGGIVVVRTDITHLIRMQEALRDSEELYRLLVDVSPYGILLHDESAITYINPAACQALHIAQAHTAIGRSWVDFVVPSEKARAIVRVQQVVHQGVELEPAERRLLTADGGEITVVTSARPFQRRGRRLALIIFFDISERKKAEAEIARQREALHQAEKMSALGSLLAGVAHELNNPLSVVVGRSIMLEEQATEERLAAGVRKIREAAERCARIVKTFLAIARQQAPSRAPVDLDAVIRSSLDLLAYGLTSSGIAVERDLPADLPKGLGDADQLGQVFNNLIINAQQAMLGVTGPRRLTIRARADRSARQLVVTIADTGPGIPADIASRIFDPFFTTKPAGIGTGIGLAVCRGIVEAHGGTIAAEPARGGGAQFRLTLPMAEDSAGAPSAAPSPSAAAVPSARVLVVDDEPEIGRMLEEILAAAGHRVDVAGDGRMALRRLATHRYDAVFSDLIMPELDGLGLFREIERRWPDLRDRVVFITGDTLSPAARRFLSEAGRPVIEKPFVPADVRQTLSAALKAG